MIPPPNDPESARPPLTPLLVTMLVFIALSLHMLVAVLLINVTGTGTRAPLGIGAIFGYGVAFALAVPQLGGEPAALLGFRVPRVRSWLAALLFVPSPLLLSEVHNILRERWPAPVAEAGVGVPGSLASTLELAVVAGLVLPAVTEIFYRGLVQPRLVPYWGSLGAVVGAAVLATIGEGVIGIQAPIALGGALLSGLLRRSSGSVYPGLLLSTAFGLTTVLATCKVFGIPGFDLGDVAHTPISFLIPPAAMVGIGLALCRGDASLPPEEIAAAAPPEEPPRA